MIADTRVFSDKVPMQLARGWLSRTTRDRCSSRYVLDFVDNDFTITENGETIAKNVYFPTNPVVWYEVGRRDAHGGYLSGPRG